MYTNEILPVAGARRASRSQLARKVRYCLPALPRFAEHFGETSAPESLAAATRISPRQAKDRPIQETTTMKRALLLFSAVALLAVSIGCQTCGGGNSCRKCQKGLFDYEGECDDENCGRHRGGRKGRGGGDGSCDDGSCGDGSCGDCGLMARMRGLHGGGADAAAMGGPPTPQYTYPYYTTRGPRDFLLDNPPTIGR
jgi:hypothetical protein